MPAKKSKFQNSLAERSWVKLGGVLISVFVIMYFLRLTPLFQDASRQAPTVTSIPTIAIIRFTDEQNDYVDLAINDLAKRLNISVEEIVVVRVVPKTFGNTSLGCPRPGEMYAQVLTPGYTIELVVNGKTYNYHAGLKTVIPCGD